MKNRFLSAILMFLFILMLCGCNDDVEDGYVYVDKKNVDYIRLLEGGFADVFVEGELIEVGEKYGESNSICYPYFKIRDDKGGEWVEFITCTGPFSTKKMKGMIGNRIRAYGSLYDTYVETLSLQSENYYSIVFDNLDTGYKYYGLNLLVSPEEMNEWYQENAIKVADVNPEVLSQGVYYTDAVVEEVYMFSGEDEGDLSLMVQKKMDSEEEKYSYSVEKINRDGLNMEFNFFDKAREVKRGDGIRLYYVIGRTDYTPKLLYYDKIDAPYTIQRAHGEHTVMDKIYTDENTATGTRVVIKQNNNYKSVQKVIILNEVDNLVQAQVMHTYWQELLKQSEFKNYEIVTKLRNKEQYIFSDYYWPYMEYIENQNVELLPDVMGNEDVLVDYVRNNGYQKQCFDFNSSVVTNYGINLDVEEEIYNSFIREYENIR